MGVEPTLSAWEAGVLPMNYIRINCALIIAQSPEDFNSLCLSFSLCFCLFTVTGTA